MTQARKPGRFYFISAIIVGLFGAFIAGAGAYEAFFGAGWADGFIYLSFGLTALVASSAFATTRGQVIAQAEHESIIRNLVQGSTSAVVRTYRFSERVRILFRGR